jgi:ribonucleoside-diphosphate reductase alpha chain
MLSQNALTVLKRRYLRRDDQGRVIESTDEMFRRVASHLASVERTYTAEDKLWSQRFYTCMTNMEFLPNSPTLMNAGRPEGQLSACFVLPIEDTMSSIFETLKQAALIHKSGGGTGFSFSKLRPSGDVVMSTMGVASGPISFITVYDAATEVVKQGAVRRGANMAVLRVDHPDIEAFITIKRNRDKLNNFNLSVGLTDAFMEAVAAGKDFELINPRSGKSTRTIDAHKLFELLVTMAWENGEPGILFLDRINAVNPTPLLGAMESTNPCGEVPLLPYESCNLGSINLVKMLVKHNDTWQLDYNKLKSVVHTAVRFLDNVIDVNYFPLEQTRAMTLGNRKIGLGIMGFADMLLYLGIPYNSEAAVTAAEKVMQFILEESQAASTQLAQERGVFPNFPQSIYAERGIALRNATTTTIAPTGTISIIAGCSSGIEPLFAVAMTRNVMDRDQLVDFNSVFLELAKCYGFDRPAILQEVSRQGTVCGVAGIPTHIQELFVTAHDITPEWHIRMQAAFQKFTHNAVSKTINYPENATLDDVREGFWLAYRYGCKGLTVYRNGSRSEQVLTAGIGNNYCELVRGDACEN